MMSIKFNPDFLDNSMVIGKPAQTISKENPPKAYIKSLISDDQ